jgi:hypothetical protein
MWLENFGIAFHRDDAQLVKDYDIKEALPDWNQIDLARKQLLVNKDQVFPYVGTYKGLSNFINLFGYKDTLEVKEFWQNVNNSSAALDQFALVNISDFLDDGKVDNMMYVSNGGAVLDSGQFKKTYFIALCYQFTKATDNYDDDGLPEVVETTDFTPAEIFYKLDGLSKKIKREILPINVVIKDIIESNGFTPGAVGITITGENFYNKFISLFDNWKSPIIKRGISSNKGQIIELYNDIYENNTDEILQLAHAGGKDIKKRTIDVMDFVIDKVGEITRENLTPYWEEYKRENPTGGRRRRFRTKKRKTKKYKKISKRNRKF